MSWREFVASLVGLLAWPLAVVVVLALFRRQVAELLEAPLSRRLRAWPVCDPTPRSAALKRKRELAETF